MTAHGLEIHGALVTLPLRNKKARPLDGFWLPGARKHPRLLIFVHGMGGNFYRSMFRKQLMLHAQPAGFDMLLFNNRGAEKDVAIEHFHDCLEDLDAALAFAKRKDYRSVALIGQSTGCQKIAYHQALRKNPLVKAIILAAIGDDLAISRRDLGKDHARWIAWAKQLVKTGKGETILPKCNNFSARRFLSVADTKNIEARLFDFSGPMTHYRRLTLPVLALLPEKEQYACIPVPEMEKILRRKSQSRAFASITIPDADHSFTGCEISASRAVFGWLASLI
jgi:pimeloyl-ACP methyl ester carboxylesterase